MDPPACPRLWPAPRGRLRAERPGSPRSERNRRLALQVACPGFPEERESGSNIDRPDVLRFYACVIRFYLDRLRECLRGEGDQRTKHGQKSESASKDAFHHLSPSSLSLQLQSVVMIQLLVKKSNYY